jgi:hypothetical protein
VTELRRLFDAQPDEFSLELLRAAEDDAPSPRSLAQAAAALGVGAMLAGAATLSTPVASASVASSMLASPSAAAPAAAAGLAALPTAVSSAATITFTVVAKQAAVGMLAGLVVMGGFYSTIGAPKRTAEGESASEHAAETALAARPLARRVSGGRLTSEAVAGAEPVAAPPAAPLRAGATPLAGSTLPSESPGVREQGSPALSARGAATRGLGSAKAVSRSAKPERSEATAAASPETAALASAQPKNASLALEVELLDRARAALLAGDAIGSLSVLDEYQGGRRSGILAPEAQVLRIQVLERLGQTRAASALARDFVERHPGSRHAAALRPLAEQADAAP